MEITISEFKDSLTQLAPPKELSHFQQGLWYAAKGNWEAAHHVAQEFEGQKNYDQLHAYLHRFEGDQWNAEYWYRRAGKPVFKGSLEEELWELVSLMFKE